MDHWHHKKPKYSIKDVLFISHSILNIKVVINSRWITQPFKNRFTRTTTTFYCYNASVFIFWDIVRYRWVWLYWPEGIPVQAILQMLPFYDVFPFGQIHRERGELWQRGGADYTRASTQNWSESEQTETSLPPCGPWSITTCIRSWQQVYSPQQNFLPLSLSFHALSPWPSARSYSVRALILKSHLMPYPFSWFNRFLVLLSEGLTTVNTKLCFEKCLNVHSQTTATLTSNPFW